MEKQSNETYYIIDSQEELLIRLLDSENYYFIAKRRDEIDKVFFFAEKWGL